MPLEMSTLDPWLGRSLAGQMTAGEREDAWETFLFDGRCMN